MRGNINKQFIKIFKDKVYLLPIFFILILSLIIYLVYPVIANHFIHWEDRTYYEAERILLSGMSASILTLLGTLLRKAKAYRLFMLRTYSLLLKRYLTSNNTHVCKVIEFFINIVYKGDFIPITQQSNVLVTILSDLAKISKGDSSTRIFIISGEAHSGKTILSKKLVNDIFTKEDYLPIFKKFSKSIFYYDFSCFHNRLEDILRNYNNGYYNNYMVIFDNIHKLNDSQIKILLDKVTSAPNNAIYTLMLTRDINYILEGELSAKIDKKREEHIISISSLSTLQFSDVYNSEGGFSDFISRLDMNQYLLDDDYIKFHLYYVYHIYLRNHNSTIIKFFSHINKHEYDSPITQGFIFICCNALFTGVVDKRILQKWSGKKNAASYLKDYINLGILSGFRGIQTWEYSMHEKTARSYISYICKDDAGIELCKKYFSFLCDNTFDEIKYRYSLPFDEAHKKITFDQIVNTGHFQSLYEDILFVIKLFNLDIKNYSYELGILNDRIGHFNLTKETILSLFEDSKNPKYLILLLHADHMMYYHDSFSKIYQDMADSKQTYIKFATNYWVHHINMHQGVWDLDAYTHLYNILPEDLDYISNESYERCHVLRRYYFDCFRIYYLQGSNDYSEFQKLLKQMNKIGSYLRNRLDEYRYYECKFIYAHYIHYELFFKYHVLGQNYVGSDEEMQFVKCDAVSDLKDKAIEFYHNAYNYFYENGDKTYHYILLRLCELAPDYVLSRIEKSVKESVPLNEFTEDNYRSIVGILDRFREECGVKEGVLEYAAYAETYRMKFTMICKFMRPDLNLDYDGIINQSADNAIKYHNEYNPHHPNEYGIFRVSLLRSINNFFVVHDYSAFGKELEAFVKECKAKKYNRELKLITTISNMQSEIAIKRLGDIVSYYPIVLQ